MLKNHPNSVLIAPFFTLVVLLGSLMASTGSLQKCYEQNYAEEKSHIDNESLSALVIVRTHVTFRCAFRFVNKYNPLITALSTLLLTLVTGALVYFGYQQARSMRTQLRAYIFPENCSIYDGTTLKPPQPARVNVP